MNDDPAPEGGRLVEEDLVPDAALEDASGDDLDHDAVAKVVSDLARQVEPPANIALFGPWGSGKSSIYAMVEARLREEAKDVEIVRYDAWKFGGHQLQRNFLMHVADALDISHDKYLSNLTSGIETTRLQLPKFVRNNYRSLLLALLLAVTVAAVWLTVSAEAALRVGTAARKTEYIRALPSASIVFGAVIGGLLLSNQTLASATEKRSRSPLQDADQFSTAFRDLVKAVLQKGRGRVAKTRLVVFIDELDRCAPSDVVATLMNLKTFLDNDSCVFIVAADRDVLESAVEKTPQAKPLRENEPYYSTAGAFLDKIFQHQINLPPVRPEALTSFAMTLANKQGGLWEELRSNQRTYEDVVYSLVPAHVQSPRRVKVLMNNFATNSRVIQARGLVWRERVTEVAVLTVLQTEFPVVVRDLLYQPRLLEAITGHVENPSSELQGLVATYRSEVASAGTAANDDEGSETIRPIVSPSGPIYTDADAEDEEEISARLRLNVLFLDAYLGKIHAAGIAFPSLELIYLQQAAHADGLEDATLARILDVAADTDPSELESAFAGATVSDKQAAIRFLVVRANSTVLGPLRANLIESACRITETFEDLTDAEAVATQSAATVLAEARKDRWRPAATPGAIILGLLDTNISDPITALAEHASPAGLAEEGFFDRLLPVVSYLTDDARAEGIHELLGFAYEANPKAMHSALKSLPDHAAARLWHSQEDRIGSVIEGLLVADSATDAQPEPEPESEALPETSIDRYTDLVTQIADRAEPSSVVGAGALLLGMRADEDALYNVAWDWKERILDSVVDDIHVRNEVALDAVSYCPDEHLNDWLGYVDIHDSTLTSDDVRTGVDRLLTDLRERSLDDVIALPGQFESLAPWISGDLAVYVADAIVGLLNINPFAATDDPAGVRRSICNDLLATIAAELPDGRVHEIRLADLGRSVQDESLTMQAVVKMREQIELLDDASAANLDDTLSKQKTGDPDTRLARARLRVASRTAAKRASLSLTAFSSLLGDSEQSAALLSEWLETRPPLAQVQKALKRSTVGQQALTRYAASRNLSDRSKLWISLHEAHYSLDHLRAAGGHGVNDTVIAALESAILSADLETQKTLVDTLLTTDISTDTSSRTAATRLAIKLLMSDVVGAGPQAAQIVIAAKGAGPNQKPSLRKAFDTYTESHPKTIKKGDIRALNDMGLLTKKKSNPISRFLDWFDPASES